MATLVVILFMFFITQFNVYFDYMFSIVSLLLCLCIRSYSAYLKVHRVSGMHYVSVVLRYCISADALYISSSEVVRSCDKPIDSSIVLSSYMEQVGPMSQWLCEDSISKLPVVDALMCIYSINSY
jgi:hypothetical protein